MRSSVSSLLSIWGPHWGEDSSGPANYILDVATHGALRQNNTEELQPVIASVTNFLTVVSTRHKGVLLLKNLLQSKALSDEILIDRGKVWLSFCMQVLKPANVPSQEKVVALHVIRDLIDVSSKIHELDRNIVLTNLSELMDILLKCQREIHGPLLCCLETLLLKYSNSMGPYKTRIQTFLVQFLDSNNKNIVTVAAKCFHILQQIRGPSEQGISYKMAWSNQFQSCLHASYSILNELFSISDEVDGRNVPFFEDINAHGNNTKLQQNKRVGVFEVAFENICSTKPLFSFISKDKNVIENGSKDIQNSESVVLRVDQLMNRFENLLIFIQALLVEPFPVAKQIKCIPLLEMLLQCLSLKTKVINHQTTLDKMAVILKVPVLRISVLRTLEALIFCIRDDVIPYVFLLLRMMIQILDESRTSNFTDGIKPYKNVRISAYNTLSCLLSSLRTLKPPSQDENKGFEDQLLANLLEDISPNKSAMQLTVQKFSSTQQLNKKQRRKLAKLQLEASNVPQKPQSNNMDCNIDLIASALSCIEAFFRSSGVFLKETTIKTIQDVLMKQIYSKPTATPVKEAICRTLTTIQTFQNKQQSSLLPYSIDVLTRHQVSDNMSISLTSYVALTGCLNGIRGFLPPINFTPIPSSNTRNSPSLNDESAASNVNDVIDLDDCSIMNGTKSPEVPVNGIKRKNDSQEGSAKILRTAENTESIMIRDSSDSESEYVNNRNTKQKKKKSIKGPVFGDTITLNVSEDESACVENENNLNDSNVESNKLNLNNNTQNSNEEVLEIDESISLDTNSVQNDDAITVDKPKDVSDVVVNAEATTVNEEIMKDNADIDLMADMISSFVDEVNDDFK